MKFTLTIDCENSAFDEYPASEIARILRDAVAKVEDGQTDARLFDCNGNRVGAFRVEDGRA